MTDWHNTYVDATRQWIGTTTATFGSVVVTLRQEGRYRIWTPRTADGDMILNCSSTSLGEARALVERHFASK